MTMFNVCVCVCEKRSGVKNTFLHLLNKNQSMQRSDTALGKDTAECFIPLPISTLREGERETSREAKRRLKLPTV